MDFANFLTLLEEPVIEWDSDSEMFCAVAVSTPAAPDDEQGPPRRVHFKDVDECKEVISFLLFYRSPFKFYRR